MLKPHPWRSLKTKGSPNRDSFHQPVTLNRLVGGLKRPIMIVSSPFPDTVMKEAAKLTQPAVAQTNGCINMSLTTVSFTASSIA